MTSLSGSGSNNNSRTSLSEHPHLAGTHSQSSVTRVLVRPYQVLFQSLLIIGHNPDLETLQTRLSTITDTLKSNNVFTTIPIPTFWPSLVLQPYHHRTLELQDRSPTALQCPIWLANNKDNRTCTDHTRRLAQLMTTKNHPNHSHRRAPDRSQDGTNPTTLLEPCELEKAGLIQEDVASRSFGPSTRDEGVFPDRKKRCVRKQEYAV
ncbi:hypothetical protein B0O80DRAFT_99590 [Mortierella sp. GBAus27b]|nr:hypothetical protein B0O80DRAFT_99590 [Mortierella sp. GBAus27b]